MSKIFAISSLVVSVVLLFSVASTANVPKVIDIPEQKTVQVEVKKLSNTTKEDIKCLADNIYFEARNQTIEGKIAVGRVVINRVKDSRWPNTVCGVIKDAVYTTAWHDADIRVPVRHKCQFSWYCDGKSDTIDDLRSYEEALTLARDIILNNRWDGIVHGAVFYHANYVSPKWRNSFDYVGRIDSHLFYR